jgi:hypothetical protein
MPQIADIKTKKNTKALSTKEQANELAKKIIFKKDFDNALTIEEARTLSLKHVRSLWKK